MFYKAQNLECDAARGRNCAGCGVVANGSAGLCRTADVDVASCPRRIGIARGAGIGALLLLLVFRLCLVNGLLGWKIAVEGGGLLTRNLGAIKVAARPIIVPVSGPHWRTSGSALCRPIGWPIVVWPVIARSVGGRSIKAPLRAIAVKGTRIVATWSVVSWAVISRGRTKVARSCWRT